MGVPYPLNAETSLEPSAAREAERSVADVSIGIEWEVQLSIPSLGRLPVLVMDARGYRRTGLEEEAVPCSKARVIKARDYPGLVLDRTSRKRMIVLELSERVWKALAGRDMSLDMDNIEVRSAPVPVPLLQGQIEVAERRLSEIIPMIVSEANAPIGVMLPRSRVKIDSDRIVTKHVNLSCPGWAEQRNFISHWVVPFGERNLTIRVDTKGPELDHPFRLHLPVPYAFDQYEALARRIDDVYRCPASEVKHYISKFVKWFGPPFGRAMRKKARFVGFCKAGEWVRKEGLI